jgi:hypothetical protein
VGQSVSDIASFCPIIEAVHWLHQKTHSTALHEDCYPLVLHLLHEENMSIAFHKVASITTWSWGKLPISSEWKKPAHPRRFPLGIYIDTHTPPQQVPMRSPPLF